MKLAISPRAALATLVVLLTCTAILPAWATFLVAVALGKALVVLGLMMLYRAGLMSFGQALYFCIGAYTAGAIAQFARVSDALLLICAGTLSAVLVGGVLGILLSRYRSIFFGLLSMAFSMILYGLLVKTSALGSTDGFTLPPPTFFGVKLSAAGTGRAMYAVAVIASWIALTGMGRFFATPLGQLGPAIRDNEIRVEYMGASAREAIHIMYVVSAALAGAGGAITALTVGHIDPEMAYWTTSGEFVFVAVLSGAGSAAAPFAGALVFEAIRSFAYQYSPNTWQMVLGFSMLAVIVFLPEGLWSVFRRRPRTA